MHMYNFALVIWNSKTPSFSFRMVSSLLFHAVVE